MKTVTFDNSLFEILTTRGIDLSVAKGVQKIHEDTYFEPPCMSRCGFQSGLPFQVGAFTGIVGGQILGATIGRYCSIAPGVMVGLSEHPIDRITTSWLTYNHDFMRWREFLEISDEVRKYHRPFSGSKMTKIGNDVWIGAQVFIKNGVAIGDGAIIAAGAVVVKDVPPYAIVGGNPARLIRYRFNEKVIEKILRLRWWRFSYFDIAYLYDDNIDFFLDSIEKEEAAGAICDYQPQKVYLTNL